MAELAKGSSQRLEIVEQMAAIRRSVANPEKNSKAREDLAALSYDYFGPAEFNKWAKDTDFGNR